jgi:hypothetical protein
MNLDDIYAAVEKLEEAHIAPTMLRLRRNRHPVTLNLSFECRGGKDPEFVAAASRLFFSMPVIKNLVKKITITRTTIGVTLFVPDQDVPARAGYKVKERDEHNRIIEEWRNRAHAEIFNMLNQLEAAMHSIEDQ